MNANPNPTNPQLSGADFDRALLAERDCILPSSGFADAVMTAVYREAAAPAPIPFPWKRALPGLAAAAAVAMFLIVAFVALLRSTRSALLASSVVNPPTFLMPTLHHTADALWLTVSLAISLASLLLCRRLLSTN
jgi:hypothetical protein